jgi:DNA invertase Pin-like site-specific DNA recombinase
MSVPEQPPKVYSYLRCSTPEQLQGHSFIRQTEEAERYAAERGWELDQTLRLMDKGVSAFRGRNVLEGQLGEFIKHVETGEVPQGSILLVESLDRISRQEVGEAHYFFMGLLRSGVNVVTLMDRKEYSWATANTGNGMVELVVSLMILARGHEESATKSRRLTAVWENKRQRAQIDGEALTSRLPAWLRLDPDTRRIETIPERAAIVQRIFAETLSGKGQHQIAYSLNTEGVKPWGRGKFWHRSYVVKILANEAVIGNFTPHTLVYEEGKRTRKPQERLTGYYPTVIAEDVWADVQAMKSGKQPRQRGRHASAPVSHMLARLAACPLCSGAMTRVVKGKRSRPKLVCARAKTGAGCEYTSVRVDQVEDAILTRLSERLRDVPTSKRDHELDDRIVSADAHLSILTDELQNVERAIREGGEVKRLVAMLQELEGEWEEARDTLRRLEAQRIEVAGKTVQSRIARLREALRGEEPDPAAINLALQTVFRRVTVDYRHGVLEFEWVHGGEVEVPYALPICVTGDREMHPSSHYELTSKLPNGAVAGDP